jgi:hypothetical protein
MWLASFTDDENRATSPIAPSSRTATVRLTPAIVISLPQARLARSPCQPERDPAPAAIQLGQPADHRHQIVIIKPVEPRYKSGQGSVARVRLVRRSRLAAAATPGSLRAFFG